MSNQINYKQKYMELKMKFMESVDQAFRLGFEQGAQQEQQNQMQQQQAQQQELEAAQAAGMGQPGQPGQPGQEQPGEQPQQPMSENPQGSELDQHIEKLESMLKSEKTEGLAEAIASLRGFQAKLAQEVEMKKSQAAIPGIVKALHKPAFKLGVNASHNMNNTAKAAVGMQHKIVTDIMKAWSEEEQSAAKSISSIISVEGLSKKE